MRPSELLFLDLETTGLDPLRHEVVEAAAVRTSLDGQVVLERWEMKVLPERLAAADPEAMAVNGYSEEAWRAAGALSQAEAAQWLHGRLRGATLAGQTLPTFDMPFLRAMLARYGYEPSWQRHCLDVASMAWPLLVTDSTLPGVRLRHLAEALGLQPEGPIHRAAIGAELARLVYCALLARLALRLPVS